MSVNRREFLKVGALGLATAVSNGCASSCWGAKGELHVRLRGLILLRKLSNKAEIHALDSGILEIHEHRPVLRIRKSALDLNAANLPASRIEPDTAGTGAETWQWDLKGKQVRFHEQEPSSDTLTIDASPATLPNPGENGNWKSTLLIPDLKKLSGATEMKRFDASAVQIPLKDGVIEADRPRSHSGFEIVWTFRKKTSNEVVLEQGLSDTLLYRCPLNGRPPVIRIDSGTITLSSPTSEFISIENMRTEPVAAGKDDPFTLGDFAAFYKVVNASFESDATANPSSRAACPKCDVDPIYCPPGEI